MSKRYAPETELVHGTYEPQAHQHARAIPLYQTAAFTYDSSDHAAELFNFKESGFIYSRLGNPTVAEAEIRVAMLEGGVAGVAFASGMAAVTGLILNMLRPNDEIVAASCLYGGSIGLLRDTLSTLGIKTRFFNPLDENSLRTQITEKTRLIFVENLANPSLLVPIHETLSAIAHEINVPYVVDNTIATPYLTNPINYGADFVIHSCTKYLDGHGMIIGGILVDAGRFIWQPERYPLMFESTPTGRAYAEQFGPLAFTTRLRGKVLMNMGACMSPHTAWLMLRGMETLHIRMQRHCENASQLAKFLKSHAQVKWVCYPELEDHPSHTQAKKYLRQYFGAMIGFGVAGGYEAGRHFIDQIELLCHSTNIGDTKTLVIHPASTTHRNLNINERENAGIGDDFIRMSVGLENVNDLITELDRALCR
ncbi:MAG: O-acetylhomoserine aminocarboxypropyltransferase/cysteine synthase [Deltaproteobacteria bacterium]|nr:O-acetylhomoserine aminocarboxypropyltransferase/cysteine synthase [Deltaproteobacteria bacterium]